MAKENEDNPKDVWKKLVKKHWKIALIIAAGIACAFIGAIFVFLWRVTGPEAILRYPQTLGLWTVGYLFTLFFDLILWELLIIGIPVIAAAIVIYVIWWKKLSAEEKQEFPNSQKDKRAQRKMSKGRGGGFFNILLTITWLIIISVDGYWDVAFGGWTFIYLVNSILGAFLWDLLILGIPATIVLIWWLTRAK
ncbi:MAG: Uncharacterized protein RBG13Loki_4243 [Promethearchaeota archaeon CR_4]|nr:MAG: Uncharacterized protein RBG13Loki_4243 [Candidatus Lokiarchaeota archaeon CR_4]